MEALLYPIYVAIGCARKSILRLGLRSIGLDHVSIPYSYIIQLSTPQHQSFYVFSLLEAETCFNSPPDAALALFNTVVLVLAAGPSSLLNSSISV